MKKVLSVTAIITMTVALILIANNNKTEETSEELIPIVASDITYEIETLELDPVEIAIKEMQTKMNEIESIEDNMEWFIAHKAIIAEYEEILNPPELYDYFTEEELNMFFRVVQAEIGDEYSFEQKVNVASVILNRIEHSRFPNTMLEVLTEDQFSTIRSERYKTVEVSEITILACEYAFEIEDTTNGCLFFDSNNALRYEFVFNDGAHNFYKIKGE